MRALALLPVMLAACTARMDATPPVQPSATADPGGRIVAITAEGAFSVPCLRVQVGQTVEWRNLSPDISANVTSLGEPAELYSPNLVAPYNLGVEDGEPFVAWRHTFTSPGVFEYFDTNQGDPGRKVTDPYYGTVTFVGTSDAVTTGVVCVEEPGSDACDGVCCIKAADCPQSQCCDLAAKRCLLGAGGATQCEGTPAHREFDCFSDEGCSNGEQCSTEHHTCEP